MGTDFVGTARAVPLRLVSGKGHHDALIPAIRQARHSIWVATANLKELMIEDVAARPGRRRAMGGRGANFRSILALFDELVGRGVDVRILHAAGPSRPFADEWRRHPRLRGDGGGPGSFAVKLCPRVHLKTVVIDGALLYLGSANFTGAGLGARGEDKRNFELGILSEDDLLLDEVQALFDLLWTGGPCARCKLRAQCPAPLDGNGPETVGARPLKPASPRPRRPRPRKARKGAARRPAAAPPPRQ